MSVVFAKYAQVRFSGGDGAEGLVEGELRGRLTGKEGEGVTEDKRARVVSLESIGLAA